MIALPIIALIAVFAVAFKPVFQLLWLDLLDALN